MVAKLVQENSQAGKAKADDETQHRQDLENREAAALEKIAQSVEITSRALVEQSALLTTVMARLNHLEEQAENTNLALEILIDRRVRRPAPKGPGEDPIQ